MIGKINDDGDDDDVSITKDPWNNTYINNLYCTSDIHFYCVDSQVPGSKLYYLFSIVLTALWENGG